MYRIEISPLGNWRDVRGERVRRQIREFLKLNVRKVVTRDVFTVCADISDAEARAAAEEIANPILQKGIVGETRGTGCDWLISVGFRPGVTDNVGRTAHEAVGDVVGRKLSDEEQVFSSVEYLLYAPGLSRKDVERIGWDLLANRLIETISIYSSDELSKAQLPHNTPFVREHGGGAVRTIDLEVPDSELLKISEKGILALTLDEMKVIQKYFRGAKGRAKYGLGSSPTDVELEAIAQTWSEHCKHKIFDAEIDYEDESGRRDKIVSCFKSFIRKSTEEIGREAPWLVSVFHDNAGVIAFNDKIDLVYKVETHNSPSALDPYGGAMTGIVGVNRDPMGTGQGADLLVNVWGYCLGSPFTPERDVPEGLIHPRRLRDGIHKGVIDGGNQSGIPYGLGWEYFDERYIGKPLVYCGTVGTLPKKIGRVPGWSKAICKGDLAVMAGGRIGKDGIHGATFSSEELRTESPSQAVQIGDPITQKKMSDFIYEARARNLYRFITDNGAGGLSSSVGEMARVSGGCRIDLSKAPLKYAGLEPWEILLSEAQERMSFAVPPENIEEFMALAAKRDVEATVLGEFTASGKFHILFGGKTVALLDMDFLHDGLPRMKLKAKWVPPSWSEPNTDGRNPGRDILQMLGRLNICSDEYKARQYDHEVKGLSVIKPFVGKCADVQGDAAVFMPEQLSKEGIVLSAAILPRYSDIDTYHMMAATIDLAVRKAVAAGADPELMAGLDNFCWPDPVKSAKTPDGEYKLAQLVRANRALYDCTKAFRVPCISGKDSMKNDSTRGGKKISIPPSVLFSVISKISDISKAVTLDAKSAGDDVYVVGTTRAELGGSEYYAMLGAVGNAVPKTDTALALKTIKAVHRLTELRLARSLHAPGLGGLAVGLAKTAMAGRLGLELDLSKLPAEGAMSDLEKLFSESSSRFIMTASPKDAARIAKILGDLPFAKIGKVIRRPALKIGFPGSQLVLSLEDMLGRYKGTLAGI